MTDTSRVQGDLRAAGERLERAQEATGAADHAVEQVQRQVLGAGFQGIAARLASVRQGLSEAQARESDVAKTVQDCAQQAATVTDGTSPQQVVARLSPLLERMDQAVTGVRGVAEALVRLEQQAAAALEGGRPQQLQAAIRRPREMLAPSAIAALSSARSGTQAVIAQAQQAGSAAPQ